MTINTADLTDLGKTVVGALPPGFLVLVLINTVFVLGLLWFLNARSTATERMLTPLLTACINEVPIAAVPHLKGKD